MGSTSCIPLTEGTHIIRVETSENAAGNKGFDEVAVTLEKREIPGTSPSEADTSGPAAVLNLYFPQAPTAEQADTLQYFRGQREPAPDDPTLSASFRGWCDVCSPLKRRTSIGAIAPLALRGVAPAHTASLSPLGGNLCFPPIPPQRGRLRALTASPESPMRPLTETQADSLAFAGQINGLQTEITLPGFAGLTAETDTLTAHITYTFAGVQTSQDLTLTETGPETRLFRFRFADPTPGTLKANIYLPVSPTPEAADVLQYYYGTRSPLPDDPVLSEAGEFESSSGSHDFLPETPGPLG